MDEKQIGMPISITQLVAGDNIKSFHKNDIHTVIAVTEDRVWLQVGGPVVYKMEKKHVSGQSHMIKVMDGANSGQLREFGYASFARQGFMFDGYCDTEMLLVYLHEYFSTVHGFNGAEIVKAMSEVVEPEVVETETPKLPVDETPEHDCKDEDGQFASEENCVIHDHSVKTPETEEENS